MKKIFVLCLFLITIIAFSQERIISGIIKDSDSKLPIDRVSVSIVGTNIGTVSNEEGEFKITVPDGFSDLHFYHISYILADYKIAGISNRVILLTPKEYLLDEVVVNKISAENLLIEAVNVSKKKLEKSILLNTYYSELIKIGDQYLSFADGILDYYNYFTEEKNDAKILVSDLYIKQSRVFNLRDSLKRKIIINDVRNVIKEGYYSQWLEVNILDHARYYDFQLETKTETTGNSIDIIHIKPKEGRKVKFPFIFKGSVICDSETRLILNIDLKFSPEHKKYSKLYNIRSTKFKVNNVATNASFKIDNNNYIMTHYQLKGNLTYYQFKEKDYYKDEGIIDKPLEFQYDLTTLDYKEGKFDLDKSKKYNKVDFCKNGNNYSQEFWKTQNVKLLSETEENIIKTLNQKGISTN